MKRTPQLRAWPITVMVFASLGCLVFAEDQSMRTHMGIQMQPQLDPELAGLPSIRIDAIQASVPVNDRMNADEAFDRPFTEALKDGMTWYLKQRGLRVVEQGEDLRLVGTIDSYEGWKGWGHWGVDVKLQLKLFRGAEIALTDSLRSFLKYADDEDVQDEEKPKYKARRMYVSFPEVLFTRVGADFSEKLITLMKEKASGGGSITTTQAQATVQERGRISIDANIPNAEVLIDGALVGTTPLEDFVLRAGSHTLEIRKGGFTAWKREFKVMEGASSRFFAELSPEERD